VQDGQRIIFAISGLDSAAQRARESEAIVNWAFRQFTRKTVLREGEVVARAPVWMGEAGEVGLAPAQDIVTLLPVLDSKRLAAEVVYTGPIRAPVAKGDPLAELVLTPEGLPETRVKLVATEAVTQGGFVTRLRMVAGQLLGRLREVPEGAS
jgi:D-alanyl-D-alanine carboxypeptidase (penicillin-binding protein 5/6)